MDGPMGLPPGVTLDSAPHDAAPQPTSPQPTGPALPPGVTLDAQPHDAPQQSQTPAPEEGTATKMANQVATGATDIAKGVGKGILDTTAGIGSMIQKIPGVGPAIIPQSGLNAEEQTAKIDQKAPGHIGQDVGKIGENVAEFAAGEEGLKGIVSFAKLAKYAPEVITMLEKYPTSAKIILGALKGGAVGGAQGAVKGAGTSEGAVKGAEGGAAGGAIGGAVGEGVSAFLSKFIKSPVESIEKAAGGSVGNRNQMFKGDVEAVLPNLVDENKINPIKKVEDMPVAAANAKAKVWDKYTAMTDNPKYTSETISGDDVAQKIKDSVDTNIRQHNAVAAKKIDKWADTFKGNMFLPAAREKITYLNSQLANFYKGTPGEQFSQALRNPELGMFDSAADAVRDSLDTKLTSLGETGAADLRNQYGALNNIQKVFEKRAIVYGRQAPMSLGQQVGNIAAVASGNPAPVAIAAAGKHLNSPGHLIRSAMSQADPGAIRSTVNAAADVAKTATAAGGAAAGVKQNDWIRVQNSDGKTRIVHPEDLAEMQKRDPGTKVTQSGTTDQMTVK